MDEEPPEKPPSGSSREVPLPTTKIQPRKKRKSPAVPWKKPPDMPRRPLSAYNIFFRHEREKILREKGVLADGSSTPTGESDEKSIGDSPDKGKGIGFANLARTIAAKWKELQPEVKEPFEKEAAVEKERYNQQMVVWRAQQEQKKARKTGSDTNRQFPIFSATDPMMQRQPSGSCGIRYPDSWFEATDSANATAQQLLAIKEQQAFPVQVPQQFPMPQASPGGFQLDITDRQIAAAAAAKQQTQMFASATPTQVPQKSIPFPAGSKVSKEHNNLSERPAWMTSRQGEANRSGAQNTSFELRTDSHADTASYVFETQYSGQQQTDVRKQFIEREINMHMAQQQAQAQAQIVQAQVQAQAYAQAQSQMQQVQAHQAQAQAQAMIDQSTAGMNFQRRQFLENDMHRTGHSQSAPGHFPLTPNPQQQQQQQYHQDDVMSQRLHTPGLQASPRTPITSTAQSMLTSPTMVPTPPQQQHAYPYYSPIERPNSAPPAAPYGDDAFDATEIRTPPQQHRRQTYSHVGGIVAPPGAMLGGLELNTPNTRVRGHHSRSNLQPSTFGNTDSPGDEESVDFLPDIHFEEI